MADELVEKRDGSSYKVLLAEDKDINQVMGLNVFKMLGCEIDLAKDGEQVLKMAAKKRYDVIFMDCDMPIIDGYKATKIIRKNLDVPFYRDAIIIALTAKVMSNDKQKCLDSGMNDYITKPINKNNIIAKMNKWCAGVVDAGSDW